MQGTLLDEEFSKLSPALGEAMNQVNAQITQGLTPEQIAVGAIALPIAYQLIKIGAGFADSRREKTRDLRERERLKFEANLRREEELFRVQLQRGEVPELKQAAAPAAK